ncbi:MAG: DinB family protein [Thermoanaerobaculia bacterium]|nr:DinB family protein [Thermoanaerobaculia bacterium]
MIQKIIFEIRHTLDTVTRQVDAWFDKPVALRHYRPENNGWTVDEILEHISLTSHFLLKLIDKGAGKALRNVNNIDLAQELAQYVFERDKLDEIGLYKSFEWIRPEHMEPTGTADMAEIRRLILTQRNRCLEWLDKMPDGEGILYRTTMSVNNLGKIDVYQYIYFLAQHAKRHVAQMERNEREYNTFTKLSEIL